MKSIRLFSKNKRGVLLRGADVAWTNGIIPYEILPGYGKHLLGKFL
jgi:hypothetical protein